MKIRQSAAWEISSRTDHEEQKMRVPVGRSLSISYGRAGGEIYSSRALDLKLRFLQRIVIEMNPTVLSLIKADQELTPM